MPLATEHIKQAEHNIRFLENFYNSFNFNDWAITVSFYASIHIIEAIIFNKKDFKIGANTFHIEHSEELQQQKNLLPNTDATYHELRNLIVNHNFPEIYQYFKPLYNDSRTARYKRYAFDKLQVELAVKTCFKEIINWANKTYSTTLKINLK